MKILWYKRVYDEIINNAKQRLNDTNTYYERHHIIPKSLGGSNTEDNLVYLTAREHFICHMLLVRFTNGYDRHKMLYAINAMMEMKNSGQQERYKISSRFYAQLKSNLTEVYSKNMLENNPMHNDVHKATHAKAMIARQNVGMIGRKHSDETKAKMRDARAKQVITDDTKRKISESTRANAAHPDYVNGCRVGWYITPWGRFKSLTEAAEGQPCTRISIKNWCKINNKQITALTVSRSALFTKDDIEKTYAEIGFGFEEL